MRGNRALGVQQPSTPPRGAVGPSPTCECSECGKATLRHRALKGPAGPQTCCRVCYDALQQQWMDVQQPQLGVAFSWAPDAIAASKRLHINLSYLLHHQLQADQEYLGQDGLAYVCGQQLPQTEHRHQQPTPAGGDASANHMAAPTSQPQDQPGEPPAPMELDVPEANTSCSPPPAATPSSAAPVAAAATTTSASADDASPSAAGGGSPQPLSPSWRDYLQRQEAAGYQEVTYQGDQQLLQHIRETYAPPLFEAWGLAALAGVAGAVQDEECMRNEGTVSYRQVLPESTLTQLDALPRPSASSHQLYTARAALQRFHDVLQATATDDPTRFTAAEVARALAATGPLPPRHPARRQQPAQQQLQEEGLWSHRGHHPQQQAKSAAQRLQRGISPAPRGLSPAAYEPTCIHTATVPRGKRSSPGTTAAAGGHPTHSSNKQVAPVSWAALGARKRPRGSSSSSGDPAPAAAGGSSTAGGAVVAPFTLPHAAAAAGAPRAAHSTPGGAVACDAAVDLAGDVCSSLPRDLQQQACGFLQLQSSSQQVVALPPGTMSLVLPSQVTLGLPVRPSAFTPTLQPWTPASAGGAATGPQVATIFSAGGSFRQYPVAPAATAHAGHLLVDAAMPAAAGRGAAAVHGCVVEQLPSAAAHRGLSSSEEEEGSAGHWQQQQQPQQKRPRRSPTCAVEQGGSGCASSTCTGVALC